MSLFLQRKIIHPKMHSQLFKKCVFSLQMKIYKEMQSEGMLANCSTQHNHTILYNFICVKILSTFEN